MEKVFSSLLVFGVLGECWYVCSIDLLRGVAHFGGENFFVDDFAFDRPGKDFNLDFGDTWLVVDLIFNDLNIAEASLGM